MEFVQVEKVIEWKFREKCLVGWGGAKSSCEVKRLRKGSARSSVGKIKRESKK